jgi:hypothetical protein
MPFALNQHLEAFAHTAGEEEFFDLQEALHGLSVARPG